MDERAAERPEAEVAMTSSISDLTYFRRQVNESLMKLQRSLLRGERQDGGGHVIQQSPPSASAACDFHVSIMLIASCCINGSERPYRNVRLLADNIDVDRGPARTCSVKKLSPPASGSTAIMSGSLDPHIRAHAPKDQPMLVS